MKNNYIFILIYWLIFLVFNNIFNKLYLSFITIQRIKYSFLNTNNIFRGF